MLLPSGSEHPNRSVAFRNIQWIEPYAKITALAASTMIMNDVAL
jgi:hypothetical protein